MVRLVPLFIVTTLMLESEIATAQQKKEADHVHILIVVDDKGDKDFNRDGQGDLGLDIDGRKMQSIVRTALTSPKLRNPGDAPRCSITVLKGDAVSGAAILNYYRSLKHGPNDALVFYYTGHGSFNFSYGHLLTMAGKRPSLLPRSDLVRLMHRAPSRSVIVLTDCCANAGAPLFAGGTRRAPPRKRIKWPGGGNGDVVRDLLLRTKGLVNITAARTGTWAMGSRPKGGSFFTIALTTLFEQKREAFDGNKDGVVEWHELFPHLEKQTEVDSVSLFKRGARQYLKFHTPEAFRLPSMKPALFDKLKVVDCRRKTSQVVLAEPINLSKKSTKDDKSGARFESHTVQLRHNETYCINLRSIQFDPRLIVKNAKGQTVASNEDWFKTKTHCQLDFRPAEDGEYQIIASATKADEFGGASLTIQKYAHVAHQSLNKTDPLDRYCLNAHRKIHPLWMAAGRIYVIELESKRIDTYLRVEDEYGNTISLNDDGGPGLNSRLLFTPSTTGVYNVVASTFRPGAAGAYVLKVK